MKIKGIIKILILSVLLIVIALNAYALDYPHFGVNNIGCDSCHFIYGTEPTLLPPWTSHTPQNIDDTQHNALCWSCHNDGDAPYVRTHSSLQTDSSYGDWTVECRVCHNPHYQKQKEYGSSGYLYSNTSNSVTATTITRDDAVWTTDAYKGMVVIPNTSQNKYVYEITGNTINTLTVQGPMDLTKVTTGNTFTILYGNLINKAIDLSKITITPAKSGSKTTRFFRTTGSKSFADGDTTYDGVCEVCHTQTTHFRNNGSGSNQLHTNVGTPAGTNCITCHSHSNGFRHGGGGGTGCGDASSCHGTRESHPTHVGGSGMLSLACSECHNTSSFPLFKDGQNLANTTACNPCHSPGGTYDGVNNANYGVKNNWTSGVYDGSALKAGKEKWCASCHDESPSVIQSISAPNVVGDEDGLYTYGTGWGFYKTGHGLPNGQKYPASGGVTAGAGKECLECHDKSLAHIDGNARTFDCGDSCNSTEYRQSYRLKQIGGQEPMFMPWTTNNSNDATRYRLCVSCHNSGPFLNSGDTNTNFITETINRHASHLIINNVYFPADYNYGAGYNSRITCVICHNVHGSTRLAMVRDGKLINREPGMQIWYRNDDIVFWSTSSSSPPVPQNLPLSASTGTIIQYSTTPNLCGQCHATNNLVGESRSPYQNVSQAPTLAWTGEILYTSDGVNPDSAVSGSSFTFRVKYTDANNDAPTVYQVWINKNDSGGYEFDEKFDMTAVDVADVNYVDGKIYKYSRTLSKYGDNNIDYCFTFSDGSAATGVPACGTNHQVLITNNIPSLSWTGEKYFEGDGVNPDTGGDGSSFTFHVKYTDADNECPASGSSNIQVWIDLTDDGDYNDANEQNNMTEVDAGDTNCTAGGGGKLYTYSRAISYAGDGDLRYRFHASDGTDSATGSSTYDSTVTVLSSANTPPSLAWTTANCLTDGVRPAVGATGADFEFRVEYTDANNQAPSTIQALIDLNDDGDYSDANETNTMTVDGGDGNYTNGEVYKYSVAINYTGDGTLKYKFAANDGSNAAIGDPVSEEKTLTVINTTYKVRPTGGSGWYDTIANALTASPASSTVLVYPNADFTAAAYIGGLSDINKTNRTLQSVCGADFTTINGNAATQAIYLAGNDGAVIDGFSITGGASYGIYANIDSFTVKNSKIYSSSIGIWLNNGCNPVSIDNTSIYSNTSYGINSASGSNLISISDSNIYNNGGGATNGAGISYNSGAGTHTITNSSLTGNTTTGNGGAIYCNNCVINIDDSTINNNTAGAGGAIYFLNASVNATITDTFIQGNESTSGLGGAIYMGSGAESLTNVMLTGNRAATNGGAIYINAGTTDCLFCTISGNYALGYAGALYQNSFSQTTIKNSIIYNNDAISGGNYKQIFATSPRYEYVDVYYTLINQSPGSTNSGPPDQRCSYEDMGGNDTSNAPFFVDGLEPSSAPSSSGDYRLQYYSYAVNAASATWTSDHDVYGGTRPTGGAYDMGADEYASGNNAPTLAWTGETNYTSDGVNPNSGIGGSSFEFQIDYTDANNNAPTVIQVWVDTNDNGSYETGEKYTMTVVGGDGNYVNGERYTKTLTIYYNGNGNIRYRFYAYDGFSAATGSPTTHSMVNITNNVPTLDWTGETNYTSDGVNPDSGSSGASFTFRVKYTDADNNAPSPIQLYIDLNDDNDYLDANETSTMTIDGGDGNYINGEIFTKTLALNHPGGASDGVLNYRFYASDGTNDATGPPASNATVTITNNAPTLDWIGSGGYTNDGADPDSGPNGTSFTFRVVYTDTDNNAPSPIQLYIDLNDDNDYDDTNEQQTMVDTVGGDGNYDNGETFTKTLVLNHPGTGDGILNYRFYAHDGTTTASGAPTSNKTVTISGSNNPPTLDWTPANCLTSGGVRPSTGATGANFEFRVKYTDQDNNPPSPIQVYIDLNDDNDYNDANEINTMTVDGGDGDYTNGEIYKYTVAISYINDGILKYKFSASDGTDAASGAPTGDLTLTVVNTTYVVRPSGGIYNTIQAAVTASSDPSTILVYPNADFTAATYSSFVISAALGVKNNRTIQSVCGANSTIVSGGTDVVSSTNGNGNVVDGFSITGGSSRGVYVSCNVTQAFTLKNSKVYGNSAQGVYANAACYPLNILNTKINNNSSSGIHMQNNTSKLVVTDSEIYSNNVTGNGGGINFYSGNAATTHTFTNTSIHDNTASTYGGAINCNVCSFTMDDCAINDNTATSFGGAMYCTNACTPNIDDSTINGNKGSDGGAFYFNSNTTAATITDSFIQGNEATSTGGAIFMNAGYANMTNVMLTGNRSAGRGGAIYMNNGYTNCTFCTISGNYSATQGGGIYLLNNYTSSLKNSIVYNNDAGSPTDANYKQIETNYRWGYMDVYNTLINQAPGSGTGNPRLSYENMGGNLTASNPNFVDGGATPPTSGTTPTTGGDYHLQSGSPAVNAGSSSYTSDHDIFDGTPGSRPLGGSYDMGAHEKE